MTSMRITVDTAAAAAAALLDECGHGFVSPLFWGLGGVSPRSVADDALLPCGTCSSMLSQISSVFERDRILIRLCLVVACLYH